MVKVQSASLSFQKPRLTPNQTGAKLQARKPQTNSPCILHHSYGGKRKNEKKEKKMGGVVDLLLCLI
jgi:hypothetical protein